MNQTKRLQFYATLFLKLISKLTVRFSFGRNTSSVEQKKQMQQTLKDAIEGMASVNVIFIELICTY